MINVSNQTAQRATLFIGKGTNGELQIGEAADALGNTVFAGVGGGVSQELKAITGSNLLTAGEVIALLENLLTSEGKRGGPDGVAGVEVTDIVKDEVTLQFQAGNGTVDTITFKFEDGLLDEALSGGQNAGDAKSTYAVIDTDEKDGIIGTAFLGKQSGGEFHVGGVLKGANDTQTILNAALDSDFTTVELVGFNNDSFSVTIARGNAVDTYTFIGSAAEAAVADLQDSFINPGNIADQFVFVEDGDEGLIGIGTANRFDGVFGGQLHVEDVIEFVRNGDTASGVEVTQQGSDFLVEFDGDAGTTDSVLVSGDLFA